MSDTTNPTHDVTKPDILVFCDLERVGGLEQNNGLRRMREKANVHQVSYQVPSAPSRLLSQYPGARGIWIADPTIALREQRALSDQVVNWVRESGGVVVLGGYFSSFVRPDELDRWLRDAWGLPWRAGQYARTTIVLQDTMVGPTNDASWRAGCPLWFSQKGVFLKNVAPADAMYAAPDGARSESVVFGPVPVEAETAIAFAKVGNGWLGWAGDVNQEEGTTTATLAMLGLLS